MFRALRTRKIRRSPRPYIHSWSGASALIWMYGRGARPNRGARSATRFGGAASRRDAPAAPPLLALPTIRTRLNRDDVLRTEPARDGAAGAHRRDEARECSARYARGRFAARLARTSVPGVELPLSSGCTGGATRRTDAR